MSLHEFHSRRRNQRLPTAYYILNGHEPVPVGDGSAWLRWSEAHDTQVALHRIRGVTVSTIFSGRDALSLFQTAVFGGWYDGEERCYETWEAAEAGHAEIVRKVARLRWLPLSVVERARRYATRLRAQRVS